VVNSRVTDNVAIALKASMVMCCVMVTAPRRPIRDCRYEILIAAVHRGERSGSCPGRLTFRGKSPQQRLDIRLGVPLTFDTGEK
jgi:hypothetical protein